jgi:hypothetical protein
MRHIAIPMHTSYATGGPTLQHFQFCSWLWNTPSTTPTYRFFTYWMIRALVNQLQGRKKLFGFLQTQLENQKVFGPFMSFPWAHTFQGDGLGLVYRHALATWDERSPKERKGAMGFQIGITSSTKAIRLEHDALLGRSMDLNSLTWLLVTCVLFQMYTTPTLIQSTWSSRNVTTWHLDKIHFPLFNTLHFTLSVRGENVPCNLTQIVSHILRGTWTFR